MKRLLDVTGSFLGLLVLSPILGIFMFLVWRQDRHSPFYVAPRVGKDGRKFQMVKLRSMVINADRTGVSSTSNTDRRITPVGQLIRKYKLDELMQLWNVLKGDMSLVGPRPQVQSGVDLYTEAEMGLLSVKPGITDFASIVFSDEGDILAGREDPDKAYDELIRPWKSRLGLFYIQNQSILLDGQLIIATIQAIVSRQTALKTASQLLLRLGAEADLVNVALRRDQLVPSRPPEQSEVVVG